MKASAPPPGPFGPLGPSGPLGGPLAPLALVGCDFRVAPASLRARLLLSADERRSLREQLASAAGACGLATLDTCNRTEWIVETNHPEWAAELLAAQMRRRLVHGPEIRNAPRPYVHVGLHAVRHFLRVASGLESLVLGEREIAGQCFRALDNSRSEGLCSQVIDQLGHAAGRTVRRLERLGRFREDSRGVAGVSVDFVLGRLAHGANGIAASPDRAPVVGVVGLGQVGRQCVQALEARGARVLSFNRTDVHERCQSLSAVVARLDELDALVVSTGAREPTVKLAPCHERARALLVVDLGVPPQVAIGSDTSGLEIVRLDELPLGNEAAREPQDLAFATETVELGVQEFHLACERRRSAHLIEVVHAKRTELRDAGLPGVLDEHLADLEPARRRRLEAALSGLLRDQQRALVKAIESSIHEP